MPFCLKPIFNTALQVGGLSQNVLLSFTSAAAAASLLCLLIALIITTKKKRKKLFRLAEIQRGLFKSRLQKIYFIPI